MRHIKEIRLDFDEHISDLEKDYEIHLIAALAGAKSEIEVYLDYLEYKVENESVTYGELEEIAKALEPKINQFHEDFSEYFKEFSEDDLLILKLAFFHYRNKKHILEMMEDKKNPKDFEKPYFNALEKIKSIYSFIEKEDKDQEVLENAFNMIKDDIQEFCITKRHIQKEKNELIKSYLDIIENKKFSHKKILEEFYILNDFLNSGS